MGVAERRRVGLAVIGNGEVGLNVWVEQNGDLVFDLARVRRD